MKAFDSPRIAVVTPYFEEPIDVLQRCVNSVAAQSLSARHILVADGAALGIVDEWDVDHLKLPFAHRDYGGTPRALAALSAFQRGFEWVAFLDADNWFERDHLSLLFELHMSTRAEVCIARRRLFTTDGVELAVGAEEDDSGSFIDTNCLFMSHAIRPLLSSWTFLGAELAACGDYVFTQEIIAANLRLAWARRPTVCYRTRWAGHYIAAGLNPPIESSGDVTSVACAWFRALDPTVRDLLRTYFQSRLTFLDPEHPDLLGEEYLNSLSGLQLPSQGEARIYEIAGHAHFHISREQLDQGKAISGVLVRICTVDRSNLDCVVFHRAKRISLHGFEEVVSLDWPFAGADLKFAIDVGNEKKLCLAWCGVRFKFRSAVAETIEQVRTKAAIPELESATFTR